MDFKKIPVTVLSGFLGGGKTTTIIHFIETQRAQRVDHALRGAAVDPRAGRKIGQGQGATGVVKRRKDTHRLFDRPHEKGVGTVFCCQGPQPLLRTCCVSESVDLSSRRAVDCT